MGNAATSKSAFAGIMQLGNTLPPLACDMHAENHALYPTTPSAESRQMEEWPLLVPGIGNKAAG